MADYVYVMDQGRIIQQGTHAELTAVEGPYRDLYEMQYTQLEEGEA